MCDISTTCVLSYPDHSQALEEAGGTNQPTKLCRSTNISAYQIRDTLSQVRGGGVHQRKRSAPPKLPRAPPLGGSGRARGRRRRRGRGGRGEGGGGRGRRGCGSWGRLRGKCGGRSLRRCSAGPGPVPYGGLRTGR